MRDPRRGRYNGNMMNSANPQNQTVSADPALRRCWWLKRVAAAGTVWLLLLAVVWVVWDQYSRRELNRRMEAVRAAGEPTRLDQIQPPTVPDELNAALLYTQAANSLAAGVDCPASSSYEFGEDLPYRPEWLAMAKRAAAANAKPLSLVRQALDMVNADWGIRLRSPANNRMLGSLANLRHLANHVADAALYEHFQGDDAQAMLDIRALLHQGDIIGEPPFQVSFIVGLGICGLAVEHLEIMSGDLRVDPMPVPAGRAKPVSREQVKLLIHELLDTRRIQNQLVRSTLGDRVIIIDASDYCISSSLLLPPVLRLSLAHSLDRQTDFLRASLCKDMPTALAIYSPRSDPQEQSIFPGKRNGTPPQAADPAKVLRSAMGGWSPSVFLIQSTLRHIGEYRMAATMLAFRLYVIDHGQYPASLDALVPTYLAALPVDPFAADGRPFGYFIAADGKRPILYSVGTDGIDHTRGGQPKLSPHLLIGIQSTSVGAPDDQYRDLSAWVNPEPRAPMGSVPTAAELGLQTNVNNPQ